MSEDNNAPQGGNSTPPASDANSGGTDNVKNVKAEFDRKLGNLTAELQRIAAAIPQNTPAAPQKKKLSDVMYEDPDAFVSEVESRAEQRVMSKLQTQQAQQAKTQTVLNQLVSDYPELADQSTPLFKKTIEIYNSLPEEDRTSPIAYKVAARDAAVELGVAPKSKRQKAESDDFVMGGNMGSSSGGSHKQKSYEIDALGEALLRAAGHDPSNTKVKDRVKQRASRRNWTKYE